MFLIRLSIRCGLAISCRTKILLPEMCERPASHLDSADSISSPVLTIAAALELVVVISPESLTFTAA